MKKKYFFSFVFLGTLVLAFALVFGYVHMKEQSIHIDFVTLKMEKALGYPVKIKDVSLRLRYFKPAVVLKDVWVYEPNTQKPIAQIKQIYLYPDVWAYLKNKNIQFKSVRLEEGKILKSIPLDLAPTAVSIPQLPVNNLILKDIYLNLHSDTQNIEIDLEEGYLNQRGTKQLQGAFNFREILVKTPGKEAIRINEMKGSLKINQEGDSLTLLFPKPAVFKLGNLDLSAHFKIKWQAKHNPLADLQIVLGPCQLSDFAKTYPTRFASKKFHTWMGMASQAGKITSGAFRCQGDFSKWPFKQGGGKCTWHLDIKGATLKFNQAWLPLKKMTAKVIGDADSAKVSVSKAEFNTIPVKSLTADIIGFKNPTSRVIVETALAPTFELAMGAIAHSPLKPTLYKRLIGYDPTGQLDLKLGLDIPLAGTQSTQVKGALALQDASLTLTQDVVVSSIKTTLNFTNDNYVSDLVQFKVLGYKIDGKLITEPAKTGNWVSIDFKLPLALEKVSSSLPAMIWKKISGTSIYDVSVKVPVGKNTQSGSIDFQTDWQGTRISLPAPFVHLPDQKTQFSGSLQFKSKDQALLQFDWVDKLKGKIYFVGVGKNLTPTLVELNLTELNLGQSTVKNIDLQYAPKKKLILIHSRIAKGRVHLPTQKENILNLEFREINLDQLTPSQNNSKTKISLLSYFSDNQKPVIHFHCDRFSFEKNRAFTLKADLWPISKGYKIKKLSISDKEYQLNASGQWTLQNTENVKLDGKLTAYNLGNALSHLHVTDSVRKGRGTLEFALSWPGSILDFSLAKASGILKIDAQNGQILKVNPGLGRLLSIFNLESLGRRLKLDFRDVYKKGFVFDKISGHLNLIQGRATLKNALIKGPAAKIVLTGLLNFSNKTLDLHAIVTSKMDIGIGGPALAGALLINPIVGAAGAAVLAVDKISGSKITGVRLEYQISGDFEAPQIKEISKNKSKLRHKRKARP